MTSVNKEVSRPKDSQNKMSAVIYARVSSVTDRQSTERQVKDLSEYACKSSMYVFSVFEEKISGAARNGERPVLRDCIDCCILNHVDILLVSELSRLGRNAFEVLETIKTLIDNGINLYMEKEKLTLLDSDGKPSFIMPVMLAVLSTCAQLERENIKFRLSSGRHRYIESGGKVGRKEGYRKPAEKKKEEYSELLSLLKKGYSVRNTAKLTGKGVSTVQRLKKEFGL